ncbi:unnamed protein product, partial [Ilex paraguariensis]
VNDVVVLPRDKRQKPKRLLNKRTLKKSKAKAEYTIVVEQREDEIRNPHVETGPIHQH